MFGKTYDLHGIRVFECDDEQPVLRNDRDGVAIIAEAMSQGAKLVVMPVNRIDPDFFQLRTGIAGAIVQKFVNYQMKLAVIGDLSALSPSQTEVSKFGSWPAGATWKNSWRREKSDLNANEPGYSAGYAAYASQLCQDSLKMK